MSQWHGMFQEPMWEVPHGFTLHVQSYDGIWTLPSGISSIEILGIFNGTLMALNSTRDHKNYVWGSAAMIAPGIAISAAHVLTALESDGHLSFPLTAVGVRGDHLILWDVNSITLVGNSDLAILMLVLRSGLSSGGEVGVLKATAKSPEAGEAIRIAGFRAGADQFEQGTNVGIELLVNNGHVMEKYENGRDGLLPGPCFAVELETRGGMSGGPAFDSEGRFVGVLSRGMADVSFISLLRNALVAEISPPWPRHYYTPGAMLKDAHGVFIDDLHRIAVSIDPATGQRTLAYLAS